MAIFFGAQVPHFPEANAADIWTPRLLSCKTSLGSRPRSKPLPPDSGKSKWSWTLFAQKEAMPTHLTGWHRHKQKPVGL